MKLIPLDAVLTEINKLVDKGRYHEEYDCAYRDGNNSALYSLKGKINTLEGKEVDLDKEIENILEKEKVFVTENREVKYYNGDSFNHIYELEFIAKHFFELGLNVAQKGK